MRQCKRNIWLVVVSGVLMPGCANSPMTDSTSLTTERAQASQAAASPATAEMRMADHQQWINRLLVTPAHEGVTPVSGAEGSAMVVPIPVPQAYAAGGKSFHLKVDQHAQLAWLMTGSMGGQTQEAHGPWKLDNSDIKHLLNSLQNPPAGATVQGPSSGQ